MNFTIKTDHKNKLIRYCHTGLIKREEIGKAWDELLKLKEFTEKKYNLLSDYRKSKFIGGIEDVDIIIDILFSIKEILKSKKQALILDEPVSTALSMVFEERVYEETRFKVKVFSTIDEALIWLNE